MSTYIGGAVEVNIDPSGAAEDWHQAASIQPFVRSWITAWDCLFGGFGQFRPVAPECRALPDDPSAWTERHAPGVNAANEGYLTLAELRKVDWTERSREEESVLWVRYPDAPVDEGHRFSNGDRLSDSQLATLDAGGSVPWTTDREQEVTVTTEALTREFVCRVRGWWWVIQELMERLAERRYPPEGIRLVAWRW